MITKINTISFVRSVKCRKSKKYLGGFKPNIDENKDNIWEDGLYIEKNNGIAKDGDNGIYGIVLDSELNIVTQLWYANDKFPSLMLEVNIGL